MKKRLSAALLGTLLLISCGQEAADDASADMAPDDSAAAVAEAPSDLFTGEPEEGAQLVFVGEDDAVLPDDRPNAVFVPLSTFSVERDGIPNEFPPADSMAAMLEAAGVGGDRIVIVGEPIPAGRAFAALDYLGLGDRAALLDGGAAALPPASASGGERPRDEPLRLDAAVREGMIVDAEWVNEHLDDPNVAILDARPPAQFSGETPGQGIDRPGHIPGAGNLFWETLVQSSDNPRLKDEAELRRLFQEAGVTPGATVVAYCRTGGQASFLYAVARHLGYNVRLYDGSFIDWSRTDYPVER